MNANRLHAYICIALYLLVCWASIDAFGWLHGLGAAAAVYLLAPYAR